MTFLQPNRSHALLTLGTLFALGGASRLLPNGLATAEESNPAVISEIDKSADPTAGHLQSLSQNKNNHEAAAPQKEVCLTKEAAEKFSEDLWLFESEQKTLKQKQIDLQTWEAELAAQTSELQDLQNNLETRWREMQKQATEDLLHLSKMYGSMKAEQAAEIFNQMDPDFAAGFLSQLPSDQAGLILANMEKQKAYIVSLSIASKNADIRAD